MDKHIPSQASIVALRRTLRGVERSLARGLSDSGKVCCGLSVALCHALLELDDAGMAMGKFAEILDLDPSTATRVVDDLVRHELAERLVDAQDRRTVRVRRSVEGARKASEIDEVWNDYFQGILAAMPETARAVVSDTFAAFLVALRSERGRTLSGGCKC